MNIIAMRQERRAIQIQQITASIEKQQLKKKELDFDTIVLATMANCNLSRRTAIDYVNVAYFNLRIKKNGK